MDLSDRATLMQLLGWANEEARKYEIDHKLARGQGFTQGVQSVAILFGLDPDELMTAFARFGGQQPRRRRRRRTTQPTASPISALAITASYRKWCAAHDYVGTDEMLGELLAVPAQLFTGIRQCLERDGYQFQPVFNGSLFHVENKLMARVREIDREIADLQAERARLVAECRP